ncbi:TAG lipase / steryl ester hydrolase / phospholipase A2 / LPA acyltransferase [Entomortierella parvispora]|uniref:TAG lipase / steryl ester hydrolase / phospholipase A2 / LPA acyltransferase n=1 Tax=Entomortierella parvispora TaxID=205924 RepID=A0A9P3HB80_9FUNG|nr:TAG lipase / steryl ester hydrolase / phospholipase A2 / LPA acyltransferase [Entomortierella parvispora]
MSNRHSPVITPVMDEDFDLSISETNLPFPYSDHCSTGPPSLYDFDQDDEESYEDENEDVADEETGENDEGTSRGTLHKEVLVEEEEDQHGITEGQSSLRDRRERRASNSLPDQLHKQLNLLNTYPSEPTTILRDDSSTSLNAPRPRLARHSFSFDSSGEWHDDEEEGDVSTNGPTPHKEPEQPEERGLLHTVTSTCASVAYAVGKHWSKKIYESLLRSRDPKAYYTHLLSAATNYEQWAEAAKVLDQLQGKDKWKDDPRSPHYDYELLQERLSQLAAARESGDVALMIFLLRTSLSRNLGNVGRAQLYANTIIGTKRLIENYNSEVIRQLNMICDSESDDFPMAAKLEFFTHTRQAFGRTALLLSGGATMGLIHIGVIKTLHENKLLPRIISGSSCGSIIAALLCTRTDDEIPSMLHFDKFNYTVFHTEEEKGDIMARILHFLKNGALFDNQVLRVALRENIGDVTFQEAYNRTRRILNITVSTSGMFEMPRLLNYLTAPNVLVWSAVTTSCAAPFVYNSSPLMAKDKNGDVVEWNPSRYHWIDGSVENDLPMNKLSELFNVNHFIVCQVNPYIVPFLQNSLARSPTNRVLGWLLYQARSELQHRMNQMTMLGIMPGLIQKTQAIMSQRYYGDITIVPNLGVDDYLNIVSNPTVDFLVDATLKGERATWPKISIIKNHCSIEHCIDDILYRLRLRRLEAYRAYPPVNITVPKATDNVTKTNGHVDQSAANSSLRNSMSVCFGTIGRSSSSPASPTTSAALGMTRAIPSPDHLNLDESTKNFGTNEDSRPPKATSHQDRGNLHLELPDCSAASAQSSNPPSRRSLSEAKLPGSGSSTVATQRRHSIPSKPQPQMSPSTMITEDRSGSVSSTSSPSSSTSTTSTSVSSVFVQSPVLEESDLFQGQGKSPYLPSPSFTALSAASSPVPSVVHTKSSVRSSRKTSTSSSSLPGSVANGAGSSSSSSSSASSGGTRSKRTRRIQMTSLE